jgi:hypothetical protein
MMVSEPSCSLASIAAMIPGRRRFRSSYLYSDSPAFSGLGIRHGWTSRFSDPFTNSDDGDTLIGQRHFGVETRVIATRRVSEENRRNKFPHLRFGLRSPREQGVYVAADLLPKTQQIATNSLESTIFRPISIPKSPVSNAKPKPDCPCQESSSVPVHLLTDNHRLG